MQEKEQKKERVIAYIDGFNLYFGMMEAGYNNCRWLNISKLASNLLKPGQTLVGNVHRNTFRNPLMTSLISANRGPRV